MSNVQRQAEVAEALGMLAHRIDMHAHMIHEYVRDMRNWARLRGRDFYTEVVADVLQIDYYEVMPCERAAAKQGLFIHLYAHPGDTITRTQDSITIETTRKNFRDMIEEWLEYARKSN
jgi:hypothetical protein